MRKFLGVIALLSIILVVSACGASEKTTTYELKEDGLESTIDYTHKGDEVVKQSTKNTVTYDVYGFTSKDEAESSLLPYTEVYEDLKGIEYNIEFNDDEFVEEITIDYTAVDFDQLEDIEGFEFEGDTGNGISLKETQKLIEAEGFKEVE